MRSTSDAATAARARCSRTRTASSRQRRAPPRSPRCRARARRAAPSPRGCPAAAAARHFSRILPSCALLDGRRPASRRSGESTTSAITGCLRACASAALTAMRVAHVVNCASPRNWREVAKDLEPRLLQHVLGLDIARDDRARRAEQPLVVAADEHLELGARTADHARDDRGVGVESKRRIGHARWRAYPARALHAVAVLGQLDAPAPLDAHQLQERASRRPDDLHGRVVAALARAP